MTAIELRFPTGRFHATPWGRHVNEGAVEWPVEPWRLLRALVATWFHKAQSEIDQPTLARLVTALAGTLPLYDLPAASLGHTRHYMPFNEGKNEKTTKIFDAFVHIADNAPIRVKWEIDLPGDERAALTILLDRLGYLGRAESLVEASLLEEAVGDYRTGPLPADGRATSDEELVQVLAPLSGAAYSTWRQDYLRNLPVVKPASKSKKAVGEPVPGNLYEALLADSGALKAAGWNLPPGAQRISYVRPVDPFRIRPLLSRLPRKQARPTVARFALASAVLPSITSAVSVGDRVHKTLVKLSDNHRTFTGSELGGTPRQGHEHAYILPECDADSDRIRFLTIYAAEGFDDEARRALSRLTSVWGYGGHDIQTILLGFGQPEDFAGDKPGAGQSVILHRSQSWVSLTPFVPTRHMKSKLDSDGLMIGSPEHDLRRLLRLHLPGTDVLLPIQREKTAPVRNLRWLQFQRHRKGGEGSRAGEFAYGFRIRFDAEVQGPLAVGYGAHFGLGLFVPAL